MSVAAMYGKRRHFLIGENAAAAAPNHEDRARDDRSKVGQFLKPAEQMTIVSWLGSILAPCQLSIGASALARTRT